MRIKRISAATVLVGTVFAQQAFANEQIAQNDVISLDDQITVLSITKTTDPVSREQLIKDLQAVHQKRIDSQSARNNASKQLATLKDTKAKLLQDKAEQEKLIKSANDTLANSAFGDPTASDQLSASKEKVESIESQLKDNETAITNAEDTYQQADLELLKHDDLLNQVFSRYVNVLAGFSDDDTKEVLSASGVFDKDQEAAFKERFETEVKNAVEDKKKAEEAAKQAREEQQKADIAKSLTETISAPAAPQAASPAAQNAPAAQGQHKFIVGGSFVDPDPGFIAALNGGAWGNCTYYIYNRAAQLGKPLQIAAMGNALEWSGTARAHGLPVSHTAKAGTIAVFQPGVAGASLGYGHVSFVEKVYDDGSVLLSEMNVKGLNVISTRVISAQDASLTEFIDIGL